MSTAPVVDAASRFTDKVTEAPAAAVPQMQDTGADPAQPENMDAKANEAWKYLKQQLRAARADNDALRARIDEVAKGAGTVAKERAQFADALKERDDHIKELEERLGRLDLEATPEFRAKYDAPIEKLAVQVSEVLRAETGLQDDKIRATSEAVLTATDEEFNQMVSNLPAPVQGSLLDKRVQFSRLASARNNAVKEWRTTKAGVEAVDDQQKVVERASRRRDLAEAAIKFSTETTPPQNRLSVLSESTYSDDVRTVTDQFRGFMQEANDAEIARAAYQGFLMPVVQRQIAYLVSALSEMRNYATTLRGVSLPPVSSMRVVGSPPPPPPPPIPAVEPGQHFQATVENTVVNALGGLFR